MRKGPRPEQNHDNKESIPLQHHKIVVVFWRKKSPEDFAAIQGRDRDEIQKGKE